MEIAFPAIALPAILPVLIVVVTAGVVLVLDLLPPRDTKEHLAGLALAGFVGALLASVWQWDTNLRGFRDMIALDNFALFVNVIVGYAGALVVLLSIDYLRRTGVEAGEVYALILFAGAGMMLLASATDLIVVFLALELMSLSLYVLAGLFKRTLESSEASMKYFLLGAFASSFFLYGIALVYGATGTTNIDRVAAAVSGERPEGLLLTGFALMLVGVGFKISSAPFHMWAPDVYEGAPTSVTAFIATGSKAAAFAVLIRLVLTGFRGMPDWTPVLWVAAVLTMTVGNVVAIAQSNVKRMLAYSSVAHVGYMLIGIVAGGASGTGAVLFYLLAYTFTTAGTFGVIALCARDDGAEAVEVGDYTGLARRNPLLAFVLSLFLLSLVGFPPLAGFVAKFYVFGAAVRAGYIGLVIIAVLNSAVAAYYYLRVIVYMYMRDPVERGAGGWAPSFAGALALAIAIVGIIVLGVVPAPFVDLAVAAVTPLLR